MNRKHLVLLTAALALACCPAGAAPRKVFDGPPADDGRLQLNNGATVAEGIVKVEVTADEEWHEYLVTVPEKVVLAPKGVYRVSYEYELTKALKGDEPYLYHLLRSGPGENDRGWETFAPAAGEKGKRRFIVRLAELKDYRLIIGIRFGGAVRISKLTIEDLTPGAGVVFLPYFTPRDDRVGLNHDALIADDAVSVDTTSSDGEWHEYLITLAATVPLKGGGKYKIGYDYVVTKALAGDGASFYHLVRTPDGMDKDKGMDLWTAALGAKGHKEFVVELDKAEGYRVILGVRFKGAIRIENLSIEEAK